MHSSIGYLELQCMVGVKKIKVSFWQSTAPAKNTIEDDLEVLSDSFLKGHVSQLGLQSNGEVKSRGREAVSLSINGSSHFCSSWSITSNNGAVPLECCTVGQAGVRISVLSRHLLGGIPPKVSSPPQRQLLFPAVKTISFDFTTEFSFISLKTSYSITKCTIIDLTLNGIRIFLFHCDPQLTTL